MDSQLCGRVFLIQSLWNGGEVVEIEIRREVRNYEGFGIIPIELGHPFVEPVPRIDGRVCDVDASCITD